MARNPLPKIEATGVLVASSISYKFFFNAYPS
jgi:hypothetical protein